MDYTGFVRYYYVSLLNKLNQYGVYKGKTVILNESLDVNKENLHIVNDFHFNSLPSSRLNINAPTEEYEKFIEYFGTAMPDLNLLLPNKTVLRNLYNDFVFNNEDETAQKNIDSYIDKNLKVLSEQKIIE